MARGLNRRASVIIIINKMLSLGTTFDVHLGLIGKRLMDILPVSVN